MLSAHEWAVQQWGQADLGDQRLTRRAVEIGARMAARPEASLPEQMKDPAALEGAYRLLNHAYVTMDDLLAPHVQQTKRAAEPYELVLFVEDTTELDYTGHPSKTGLGPIGDGNGRGLLMHSTLALVPDGRQVLGLAHVQVVRREPVPKPKPKWTRSPEGQVWEVSAHAVGRPPAGVTWVHVSDRASDIFEYMAACVDLEKHFVLRVQHNRLLSWHEDAPQTDQAQAHKLLDYARSLPERPGSHYTVEVPAHKDQPARQAQLALALTPLTVAPPSQAPPDIRHHPPLKLWLLRAWEPDAPDGVEAVEWVLLSSLPIVVLSDAQRTTEWYTCRWFCEDFHQCLKTGCRVEHSQLDDGTDIEHLLGFAAPIAVRLLQLRQAARHAPEVPACHIVDPLMVEVLARRYRLEAETMTAQEFWRRVARLGGFQGRRRDGDPGWRTVWRGWRYLSDLTEGARLFAPNDTS